MLWFSGVTLWDPCWHCLTKLLLPRGGHLCQRLLAKQGSPIIWEPSTPSTLLAAKVVMKNQSILYSLIKALLPWWSLQGSADNGQWYTHPTSISRLLILGCSAVLEHISCFSFFRFASIVQAPRCIHTWDYSHSPVALLLKAKGPFIENS